MKYLKPKFICTFHLNGNLLPNSIEFQTCSSCIFKENS